MTSLYVIQHKNKCDPKYWMANVFQLVLNFLSLLLLLQICVICEHIIKSGNACLQKKSFLHFGISSTAYLTHIRSSIVVDDGSPRKLFVFEEA